jgi:hypothetical protein
MTRTMCRRCRDATRARGGFPLIVRRRSRLGLGETRGEQPDELRRRRRPHLRPRLRQVVLHGRVRQAEAVGGRLLRSGDQDGGDHADLAVGRAPGGAARRLAGHALRSQSNGSGGSASRIVTGRAVVAGLCLSPRPDRPIEIDWSPAPKAASHPWAFAWAGSTNVSLSPQGRRSARTRPPRSHAARFARESSVGWLARSIRLRRCAARRWRSAQDAPRVPDPEGPDSVRPVTPWRHLTCAPDTNGWRPPPRWPRGTSCSRRARRPRTRCRPMSCRCHSPAW